MTTGFSRPHCDRTVVWPMLRAHYEREGKSFDARKAFYAQPQRFETFSQQVQADRALLGGKHRGRARSHPPNQPSPHSCQGHRRADEPVSTRTGRVRELKRCGHTKPAAPSIVIGIDVSKDHLEACCLPNDERWEVPNDDVGIAEVVRRCQARGPERIVLEATAGSEVPLLATVSCCRLRALELTEEI